MKLTFSAIIAAASLVHNAGADFDLYGAGIGGNGISGNAWGYQVYDGEMSCKHVLDWIWRSSSDVSGGKYGVRCKGCDGNDPSKFDEVEMNFNTKDHHWTMYSSRGWGLFDLSDKKVGSCQPASPAKEFYCGAGVGRAQGQHLLHCTISGVTAADINAHKP